MNYRAFTNDSLRMMYAAIRGALTSDDLAERQGDELKFKVRDTPDWKKHSADLEGDAGVQVLNGAARPYWPGHFISFKRRPQRHPCMHLR